MPPKTPGRIKEKVIKLWLLGYTRDQISQKVGISVGNILHIVSEAKKNLPDITLLRECAVRIRKQSWTQDTLSTAIRHRNILKNRGLTHEQIDLLIELVDEHCFKREIPIASFIDKIENISLVSKEFGCEVMDLDSVIAEKESQAASARDMYHDQLVKYAVTASELEQYKQDEPLVETIIDLRGQLQREKQALADWQLDYAQYISKSVAESTAKELPEGMNIGCK